MIKRLRRKLIVITMVLLTMVLTMILCYMYYSTQSGLQKSSVSRMQASAAQMGLHGRPGSQEYATGNPCFVLRHIPGGELMAVGADYYDLDDPDALMELLDTAEEDGKVTGLLKDHALRYLRLEDGWGRSYVFMDVTSELQTLSRLNITCGIIFVTGMLVFFLISLLLARWAVRPVEEAWEQQRQFVADASHELKTPLTVILTNAELLTSDEYHEDSKKQFSQSILTMSRQMRGLVEELLNQARVDSGTAVAEHRKLDYSKLVSDAILPFEPLYFESRRFLRCSIEPEVTATGDAEHLCRVIEILLDNACKYSPEGAEVKLRLVKQGRGSLLSVSNPGVSMTAQQCRDIFKRFYRMDSARAMNRSYGLGLSIAHVIVEQHMGKIWAESRNEINTFYVSLPL